MMSKTLLVVTALLVLPVKPLPSEDVVIQSRYCASYSLLNGRSHELRISAKDLADAPAWSPASGAEPPVSVRQARMAAINEFNRYMKDRDDWYLLSISLRQLCMDENWLYVFQWEPKDPASVDSIMVPVLMSGKAISLDGLKPQEGLRR